MSVMIVVTYGAALLVSCAASAELRAEDAKPNIIWIMADDLGWGEVGLFPSTSQYGRIATPHLDKFGQEGTLFWNAYAGYSVCAPSRTTFFTGRHSGSFVKHGLNGAEIKPGDNVLNLGQMLHDAGYTTGLFGKSAPLTAPLQQGFDAFVGQVDQAYCHNMYPIAIDTGDGELNFPLTGNTGPKNRNLCMARPDVYNYTVDVFHKSAMQWIQQVAQGSKPFFLYLAYTVPHAGGWEDAPSTKEQGNPVPTDLQYADKDWPEVEKDHAAVITYMDSLIGDLMKKLKELGVDDNTLVFFASDNGASHEGHQNAYFFNSTGGLRGYKRSLFEGGVRSPSMVRWPGVVPANKSSDHLWAFWDVLPTLAELVGSTAPEGLDGTSIMPTLLGRTQDPPEYLYWTWPGCQGGRPGSASGFGVRIGSWKGVVPQCHDQQSLKPTPDDVMQLYNLDEDPFETTDVAHQHLHVVKRLKEVVISKSLTCQCFQCKWLTPTECERYPGKPSQAKLIFPEQAALRSVRTSGASLMPMPALAAATCALMIVLATVVAAVWQHKQQKSASADSADMSSVLSESCSE